MSNYTHFERPNYISVYPPFIFRQKRRHFNDNIHIVIEANTKQKNVAKSFFSTQSLANENQHHKKNYYEQHPFYALFYSSDKESEMDIVDEEESNQVYATDDDVEEKIDTNVVQVNNTNVILEEWEDSIQWESDIFNKQHQNQIERPNCVNQWRIVDPVKEPLAKTREPTTGEWSLFSLENELLQADCWETDVLWNESDVEKKKPMPLYLDLNDSGLLLTEAVVPLQKQIDIEEVDETPTTLPKIEKPIQLPSFSGATSKITPPPPPVVLEAPKDDKEKENDDKEKKEIKIWKISDDRLEDLSNDRYYFMGKTGYTQKKFIIYHSKPATTLETFQTHLTMPDLRQFHRPLLTTTDLENINVQAVSLKLQQKKRNINNTFIPQTMKELSSKDGRIHLVEYIEEYPPLLSQIGMGARIRNYCKREDEETVPKKYPTGEMVIVEREEESPFLGKVKAGASIQSLDNKMTKTPIHECKMKSTDFLLIRSADGKNWNVREIDHLFVGGQQQPQKDTEIPVPGSKAETSFHKDRLETTIYLSFHKNPTLRVTDFVYSFPNQTETTVRKILRKCANFNRRGNDNGGSWEKRPDFDLPSEEDLFAKMTPERVCCYEAMNAGKMRLQDRGIGLFKYSQLVSAKQNFDPDLKKRIEPLIEEVRRSPWTSMNILAKEMKGTCPSDYNVKDTDPRHLIEYYRRYIPKQIGTSKLNMEIKDKYGDLRKLTIPQLRANLKDCGVTDDSLLRRSRWDLVALLSKEVAKSIGISTEGSGGNRPTTNSASMSKKMKKIKEIFREQIAYISEDNVIEDDEESDSDQEDKRIIFSEFLSRKRKEKSRRNRIGEIPQSSFKSKQKQKTSLTTTKSKILPPDKEFKKQHERKEIRKNRERLRRLKHKKEDSNRLMEKKAKEEGDKSEKDLKISNRIDSSISLEQKDDVDTSVDIFSSGSPGVSSHLSNDQSRKTEKKDTKKMVQVAPVIKKSTRQEKRSKKKISIAEQLNHSTGSLLEMIGEADINPTYDSPTPSTYKPEIQEKSKLKILLESCMEYLKQKQYNDPIDLSIVAKKIRKDEYREVDDFVRDVERIVDNCFKYNSRGIFRCPTLIPYADFLYECTTSFIAKNKLVTN
ncbi:Transcription initiation factor tfiid [Entamoeba marina]